MKKLYLLKSMFLLCALVVGSSVWAETYTMSIDSGTKNGTKDVHWTSNNATLTHSNVSWSASFSGGAITNSNNYVQIGSGNSPFSTITLGTSGISGTITEVKVGCGAYQSKATVAVTVGGNAFGGNAQSVGAAPSTSGPCAQNTFTGSASGTIVITITNGSDGRAGYIDYVSVTYSTTYSVTYNGNGNTSGTAPTDATAYSSGATVTVLGNTGNLEKTGYTFGGWNTQADGNGTDYAVGGTFTINASTTLYAQWTLNPHTVTLSDDTEHPLTEASGGAGVTLPSRSDIGSYTFAGWSETNVDTETTTAPTIIPAGSYGPTENITLYPVYTRIVGDGGPQNKNANKTMSELVSENSYDVSTSGDESCYTSLALNGDVTISTTGSANCGSFWGASPNIDWRLYQNKDGNVIVSVSSGELTSITFTFTASNSGTLNYNSSTVTSGTAVNVSGTSAEFTVSRTGSGTNGQIRITEISVDYTISGVGATYYFSSPQATKTITLNSSGYATYCSEDPIDFSSTTGYTAWRVSGVSGTTITFEQITEKIKGGQGVLLYNKDADGKSTSEATITFTKGDGLIVFSDSENKLVGTTAPLVVVADEYYGLSGESFVKVNAGTVPAGKALLPASVVDGTNTRQLTFVFEGTQGISEVEHTALSTDDAIYSISGQRVSTPKKGLYIVNGKKVVMK